MIEQTFVFLLGVSIVVIITNTIRSYKLRNQMSDLQEHIEYQEDWIQDLEERQNELESYIEDVDSNLADMSSQIDELDSDSDDIFESLNKIKKKVKKEFRAKAHSALRR